MKFQAPFSPSFSNELERALLKDLRTSQTQAVNSQIALAKYDENGSLIAGLEASTSYGWVLIKMLWVARSLRKQGYGSALVAQALEIAKSRGCHAAWLDTSSEAAHRFYLNLGFEPFALLENGPSHTLPDHRRWFLMREITS